MFIRRYIKTFLYKRLLSWNVIAMVGCMCSWDSTFKDDTINSLQLNIIGMWWCSNLKTIPRPKLTARSLTRLCCISIYIAVCVCAGKGENKKQIKKWVAQKTRKKKRKKKEKRSPRLHRSTNNDTSSIIKKISTR
jgi:hypothetical protein